MTKLMEVTNQTSPGGFREFSNQPPADWYDVEVTAPDETGMGASIALDGVPMKGVLRWSTEVGVQEANKVTVTFYAKSINRRSAST